MELCENALTEIEHTKVTFRYVVKFRNFGLSLEFCKAVWARYKADSTGLTDIPSLAEQRAFAYKLNTEDASNVLQRTESEKQYWVFEGIVTVEKVSTSGIRGKLQDVQRLCEDGGKTMLSTIVDLIEFAGEGVEAKRENRTMFIQTTDIGTEHVEARSVNGTKRVPLARVERRIVAL